MDLKNLPSDPFEARFAIQKEKYNAIAVDTIKYIQNEYQHKDLLYACIDFINYDFIETSNFDFEELQRIWLFPAKEASAELNESLNKIINASYKAAYDSLRRALEIMIIGSSFAKQNVDVLRAQEWLNFEHETPFFSRAIESLLQDKRIKKLEQDTFWITQLKNFYFDLSDIVHVRGEQYSREILQPAMFSYNGIDAPHLSLKNLHRALDTVILIVQHICTSAAIINPILLIGLPLEKKYGIDASLSGFFNESQSILLWQLLLPDTKSFFEELVKIDDEIISIAEFVNNLPDITEQELDNQIEDFKKFLDEMKESRN
ncbi:MAG: hypothetical protein Q8N83_15360 [Ignavibacteria bacterium]|nr:hypothetical protein [Ignavibacteria bacterium]